MSGLTLNQFRYTTTTNDDLVIGEPSAAATTPKYIVFQTTDLAGPSNNPHIKCYKSGGNWQFAFSTTGANALDILTAAGSNTFQATNTFTQAVNLQGATTITASGSLNVEPNTLIVHANQAGVSAQAGILVHESGTLAGWARVHTDRNGWSFRAPGLASTLILRASTSGEVTLTAPATSGTIATESYVTTAVGSIGVTPAITAYMLANPRRTNIRFFFDNEITASTPKQPVMRIPSNMKVESAVFYRDNAATITSGSFQLYRKTAGNTVTTYSFTIAPGDATQSFVSIPALANLVLQTGDAVTLLVTTPGTGIKELTIDLACVLDY